VKKMAKLCVLSLLLVFSGSAWLLGDELPEWYTSFRDAVYSQNLSSRELAGLYTAARESAARELSGAALSIMLSRCEYMMGRAYQYEDNKDRAAALYENGMNYAQEALDTQASSEGWQMLAENISQSCAVRSAAWAMANGLKVERYAKNALNIDSGNTAAQYMIAARYVYAPSPFNNYRRGIQMMEAIARDFDHRLQRDDRFNVYSSIGYAYHQQKRNGDAKTWFAKALEVYPDNKFVGTLLAEL
jgi:tetratricopeptide (TPR) repeat protein